MEGITVKQLMAMCKKQIALGNGDKEVIITSDDEGNEYHQVWSGMCDGKELVEWVDGYQMCHCKSDDISDYVLIS